MNNSLTEVSEALENFTFQVVAFGEGYQLTAEDIEKLCKVSECLADIENLFYNVYEMKHTLYFLQETVDRLKNDVDNREDYALSKLSVSEIDALKEFIRFGNPSITLQGIYSKLLSIESRLNRGGLS